MVVSYCCEIFSSLAFYLPICMQRTVCNAKNYDFIQSPSDCFIALPNNNKQIRHMFFIVNSNFLYRTMIFSFLSFTLIDRISRYLCALRIFRDKNLLRNFMMLSNNFIKEQ